MAIKPYLIQRRMRELGRVRLGEKGPKGEPRKLATLRFTSFSESLLQVIAEKHGGTVRPWVGSPEEGAYEVTTETNQIDIILPPVFSAADGSPTTAWSQFFEMWSGGGCQRRCDGETESISGKPCMCNPDDRACKLTTRISFMIPDVPDVGVWRLDTKGWNAATELPGTLEVLMLAAAEHKFIQARLRAEPRTKKTPGEGTRRFIVPVIELPGVTVNQLVAGEVPLAINAPPAASRERPALPAAPPPENGAFQHDESPGFGAPPALPGQGSAPAAGEVAVSSAGADDPPMASDAQKKKLNVLVGKLRDAGHISTEQLYRAMEHDIGAAIIEAEDSELHWSPLRDELTKTEATQLIDRLTKLEQRVTAEATT